jgi:class 3 adenylate cyclase/tetratricopeptide (TPR) repeat protein
MCATALVAASEEPGLPALDEAIQRLVPKEFAERLLATRGQVSAERRMVTILFSDVKGSTAMAEELDPEDVMEIMDGAFDVLIDPIMRYEGTLARMMGDAVLAFFGAPIAHEDDPERACRAALEIVEGARAYAGRLARERGIEGFNVRVGINTGLVVVGEVGSDLRVEYTAMGDAINLAARMEGAARPGTVLITNDTHELIEPLFDTEDLGVIQVKGREQPVAVHRLVKARGVPGRIRGIPGLESPLVGRETEFAALGEVLGRLRAGVGGIVTVVGDAGIGKSRLVTEARAEAIRGQADGTVTGLPLSWIEGHCPAYGSSVAYLLWLDVIRGLLDVTFEDSTEAVRDRLRETTENLCPDQFEDVYPFVARLMSLPVEGSLAKRLEEMDSRDLKKDTFRAIETLICCAARERALALVCEDLHWADPTSIEVLQQVLGLTDQAAILFIFVFRPRRASGCWQIRELAARDYPHRHTDVWLQPLSPSQSEALVQHLLQAEAVPAGFRRRILSVAEGNPFYVEEILRGLINQGVVIADGPGGTWRVTEGMAKVELPTTLQGALLARIDRLNEAARRVLQIAAVIGRIFLYRILETIAAAEPVTGEGRALDEQLITLQREQMIRERARIPELEYIFKHELTREAAYNGLLRKERRAFHRLVAEALEEMFPDRAEEHVELLAHHWRQAGDRDKALAYLIRAGDRARRQGACVEAVDAYTEALKLVEASTRPDRENLRAELLERRGQSYVTVQNMGAAREDFYRLLAWSRQAGARRREAQALVNLIQPLLIGHQLDEATDRAEEAYAIATELEDNLLVARSTGALGSALCVRGELDQARRYLQSALAAGRLTGAGGGLSEALFYSMMERNWVGDFRSVLTLADEAWVLAEKAGDPNSACGALFCTALAQCGLGDYELALDTLGRASEIADSAGLVSAPAELLNTCGWVYQEIYNLDRSAELNAKCVQEARDLGEIETEANALVNLGVDHLWLQELEEAKGCFEAAEALLEKQFGGFRWRWRTRLLAAWGELYLARGSAHRALEYAEQCLQLAVKTSARKNQVKGWRLQGEALAALDRVEEGVAVLLKAANLADEVENPPLTWKSHFALGRALSRLERLSEARIHYEQAAATIERTAAGLKDLSLRETFLSAGPVRAVLEARFRIGGGKGAPGG